jgi:CheY-like chemotaxis protein
MGATERDVEAASAPVLIIDDDPFIAEITSELLVEEGFAAVAVFSGNDALDWIAAHGKPFAVVLDLMMPEMTGWDLLDHWTGRGAEPLPFAVVVVSAFPESARRVEPFQVDATLAKPIDMARLVSVLRRRAAARALPVPSANPERNETER